MRRLLMFWRVAKGDLPLLWFALRHPDRPAWLLPATALLAIYAIEPMNFAIPLLGMVDDFIVLPMLLHQMVKRLPPGLRQQARTKSTARAFLPVGR